MIGEGMNVSTRHVSSSIRALNIPIDAHNHPLPSLVPSLFVRVCSGARRDEDGYYWLTGRTDDVLVVSVCVSW